eukprot:CAMPEP_0174835368 /NCGR_PEP_ID=MMETSP1114-20130205/5370_1 /TAXON_ID=312471 /ORGANISM="Neobodo designis, Strain CCAP 1951/1" /LENGTH=387 /DNA_ID=CAMNT_0016069315 /DNA_START=91 /DNA_END=1254 /DNA_ORIENTATION=-
MSGWGRGAGGGGGGGWGAGGGGAAGSSGGASGTSATQGNHNRDLQLPETPSGVISSVRWTPPGCVNLMVGATSWDKSVRVWGVQTQEDNSGLVTAMKADPIGIQNSEQPILSVDFAKDGRCFYAGCDRAGMMWDLQSGQTQQVAAHEAPICCARFQEDGAAGPMLVTSGWDAKVRFWDVRQPSGTPAKEENFGAPVHDMDLTSAPLATFLCGRKCVVYDLQNMAIVNESTPVAKASYAMRRVANLADRSASYACTVDGRVVSLPVAAGQTSEQFKAHGGADPRNAKLFDAYQVNFISAHPVTNRTVFTGASDGLIRCFDLQAKGRFYEFPPRRHNGEPLPVSCGALSPGGTMLAYGVSYDWSLGKDGYDPTAPQGVFIKPIEKENVR